MFERVLVANRGEIACRVLRTLKRLGIRSIAVCSEIDRAALFVQMADEVIEIGKAPVRESYLRGDKILEAARRTGAHAIHPGYGFLSENAAFAQSCIDQGVRFIGPSPEAISAMGLKDAAKRLMEQAGVPVVPGYHGAAQDLRTLRAEAARIGYPVLIKAVSGGGGKGMRRVDSEADFATACEGAQREALAAFGDDRVLIEKYLTRPRHIEVQVFADAHGNALHLFERDCSLQRRHQKVIEEAPAPELPSAMRNAMGDAAVRAARAIGYEGAGTVEFIADATGGLDPERFYFMEMNTRLQVEHPVTECITGLDLVEWQLRVAAGQPLPLQQSEVKRNGHAIEARLYAEDPSAGYLPQTGELLELVLPETGPHVRVDSGVVRGDRVSVYYDPMVAKIIAHHEDRTLAAQSLARALSQVEVLGLKTNAALLSRLVTHPQFLAGTLHTGFLQEHEQGLLEADPAAELEVVLLASVGAVLTRRAALHAQADKWSPWNDASGFLINDVPQERFILASDEVTFQVLAQVRRDEIELHIVRKAEQGLQDMGRFCVSTLTLAGTQVSCLWDSRRLRGRYAERDEHVYVSVSGQALRFAHPFVARSQSAREAEHAESTVKAPMPGKITRVLVTEGERVERGAVLLCLEAMKMEHTLKASLSGVVSGLRAREGDQVEAGSVLLFVSDGKE